ncbi:MAG: T9SS type A sorting domain-containing protein [Ignavibacteria bacterium]
MKKLITISLSLFLLFFVVNEIFGWGSVGHSIINRNSTKHFPQSMIGYASWSEFLAQHASDADYRKSSDPTEGNKHFIDIDNYQEFFTGNFPYSIDTLISRYGWDYVWQQGILPWATKATVDSLTAALNRKDWQRAKLLAADLGHYIADGHQPLHVTRNYDGQYTGQRGIHSRYETQMINRYQSEISISTEGIAYVHDPLDFIFDYLFESYTYLDDVLRADSIARSVAGNTTSETYYSTLWNYSQSFTKYLFQKASVRLASLIYTAWINAGSPELPQTLVEELSLIPTKITLYQNYPNPFNYSTQIRYFIPKDYVGKTLTFKVTDTLGKEITSTKNQINSDGYHQIEFDGNYYKLSSGTYIYTITIGDYSESKKMEYIK